MKRTKNKRAETNNKIALQLQGGKIALNCAIQTSDGETPEAPPKFSMVAYTGAKMTVYGFDAPVVIDLAGIVPRGERIPVL